jgi:hypothetical protein
MCKGVFIVDKAAKAKKLIMASSGASWVMQKYLERPLLIRSRKFDMRLWVMMASSFEGDMRCWVYQHGYCRFCMFDYSTTLGDDESVEQQHLTNSLTQAAQEDSAAHYQSFEWLQQQLAGTTSNADGALSVKQDVLPQIHRIARETARAAMHGDQHGANINLGNKGRMCFAGLASS